MTYDQCTLDIQPDGNIQVHTDQVGRKNQGSLEEFIALLGSMAGGPISYIRQDPARLSTEVA